jgi:FkbM family methyltransferase
MITEFWWKRHKMSAETHLYTRGAASANILGICYDMYFHDRNSVKTVLDIGANDFKDSEILAEIFPNATIHAFEPRATKDKKHPRIKVHRKAVSDSVGKQKFYMIQYWAAASSLLKPKKDPGVKWTMTNRVIETVVETTTIDYFCEQNNIEKVDIVWMDIQGNELRAIKGMANYIQDIKLIQTEAGVKEYYEGHTLFYDIAEFLESNNFLICYNVLEGGREFELGVQDEFETDVIFLNTRLAEKNLPAWAICSV